MCGRYRIKNTEAVDELTRRLFGVPAWASVPFTPRYNIAPSQNLPVLALGADGRPIVASMRWGFVPFWEKSDAPKVRPINVQSEHATTKPMFRQAVQKRRCLVPADGFYEWRRLDEKTKQAFDIHLKGERPFFFAGIFEGPAENRPATYAILTTRANPLMVRIHDRMPAIVDGEAAQRWLSREPLSDAALAELTAPHDPSDMEAVPVSAVVNSPARDVPECLTAVAELEPPPPKPQQQELPF